MYPTRIIIADESDLSVLGARSVLEGSDRYRVVGWARHLDQLLGLSNVLRAEVVVWHEDCQTSDILTSVEQVKAGAPAAKRLMIGSTTNGLVIRDVMEAGLDGYLYQRDELGQCLLDALAAMMRSKSYLSPTPRAIYKGVMEHTHRRKPDPLSTAQRRMLYLLAHGASVSDIASDLQLSERRVYELRKLLRRYFNARTNAHLIQRAARDGYLRLILP